MSHDTNVVATWRERAMSLGRKGFACGACGRGSLARRRVCLGCGAAGSLETKPLPTRATVAALSLAGAAVEHLDQVTERKAAVLLDLGGQGHVACLLAHADSITLMSHLRGAEVQLSVRRIPLAIGESEPIRYGLKASVPLATRCELVQRNNQAPAGAQE